MVNLREQANVPHPTYWSACTAQRRDGSFCDRPTLPDAPFPICLKHASEVYGFLRGRMGEVVDNREAMLERASSLLERIAESRAEREEFKPDRVGRVYYVQVGPLIKIGFTERLAARIASYPPNSRLLASETGDYNLEYRRHEQFRHLLAERNEWFRPAPDLLDHINAIRRSQRLQPITMKAA